MATFLTLGPVLFTEFEAPEVMPFPVRLELRKRLLPGGGKRLHAIAIDYPPIEWTARFRGPAAETKARELIYLTEQQQVLPLAWSTLRYQVLIESFEPRFIRTNEVPYSIRCEVVEAENNPLLDAFFSLDTAVGTDVNQVVQIGAALNLPGIDTAVAGVATAASAITTFEGADAASVSALQSAVSLAQGAAGSQIAAQNAATASVGGFGGVVPGGDPGSMAAALTASAGAFSALPQLLNLQAGLGRIQTNLANA